MLNGKYLMLRNPGLIEWAIATNISYPVLLIWLYFAIFWKLKQASPGQIASGNAVVQDNGSREIGLPMALKRSAMFLTSCFTIFGLLMIFAGDKKTLHDKICGTRVVE